MLNSAKRLEQHSKYLFILPSGNVIQNNAEGVVEMKYLDRLSKLLAPAYITAYIPYPQRRTAMYSSAYFKSKAVVNLKTALDKVANPGSDIVLLGLSAGAEVIMKFLTGRHTAHISKAICVGLFTGAKRTITTKCRELFFVYGENDFVGIINNGETTVLTPETYAPACIKNIYNPGNTVAYRIIQHCSHTLIPEKNIQPELILKKLITT